MAIPPTSKPFDEALDPKELTDFYMYVSQGAADAKPAPLLLLGEAIDAYTLTIGPEASAAGLIVDTVAPYATTLVGNLLTCWFKIDPAMVDDPIFDGDGVRLPIEFMFVTNANPPRIRHRTFLLGVVKQ